MINGRRLLQFYILWTTNREPKCGYDIMKELEDFFIIKGVSQAVIYLNLRSMESKGVLDGATGSRNKTIYSLTERGEKLLLEEKEMMKQYILKFSDIINYVMDREEGVVG